MQATMPATQIDSAPAAPPAEAKSAARAVSAGGQFNQHLKTAGKNLSSAAGKGNTEHPVPADDMDSPAVKDQNDDSGTNVTAPAAGDLQLLMAALQSQSTELSTLTGRGLNTGGTQHNARLQTLLNSIQIQDTSPTGQNSDKPMTTLASLLEKTIASGSEKQPAGNGSMAAAGTQPTAEQQAPPITVENWRAQFSYQSGAKVQDLHNPKSGPGRMQQTGESGFREPVLAYRSPEIEQVGASDRAKHGTPMDVPSQPRDANSNFIHSNLPGVNVQTEGGHDKNAQQQNSGEGRKNPARDVIAQVQQDGVAKSGQDVPLIFTLDQDKAPGLMTQGPANSTSPILRLPSGTEVPHNQIINQVVDRFTLNRTLESGNISMKLHPAELGELRMEIKVEQDNIKAHITTQNPQVQEILDRHLPRLREALEQQGLNLEQMQVTVGTNDGGNSQLFQEHFGNRQPGGSPRSNSGRIAFSLDQEPPVEENIASGQRNLSVLI